MCRKSSIVPDSSVTFDKSKYLCRNDVSVTDFGIVVLLKYAKTNQFGDNNVVIPLCKNDSSSLCPVKAFQNMCRLVPLAPSEPLFGTISVGEVIPLDASCVDRMFRRIMTQLPIAHAHEYTMHSFRRGGASFYFKCGVPGELIQLFGNWKSDCYLRYLRFSFSSMTDAARLVAFAS
ncbi:uncharacterized protein LOC128215918 [Mya arenaria]|uniref:uncharacterized protein LOC128215918 n=1 Tax=Mya arenaria TaxID=6604 RepID=UPI0022E4F663|nr:uncharacterized protein LOC128215918 [Mya arenaria]